MSRDGYTKPRGGFKAQDRSGFDRIPLRRNWTAEHDAFVQYLYACGFDSDVIKDRFLRQFQDVLQVVGVETQNLTRHMVGRRVSAIGGRVWRLRDVVSDKAAIRSKAMTYAWGSELVGEVESVPSGEGEDKEVQLNIGLLWDRISKEKMKALPIVLMSKEIEAELAQQVQD